MNRDYYSILEVKPDASATEIQRAYRALALRYHPDRNAHPEAVSRMSAINEAYGVLSDARRRRLYDSRPAPTTLSRAAGPILIAAREAILRSGWKIIEDSVCSLMLERAGLKVRILLVERVNNSELAKICRTHTELTVVLAVEIETPINLALHVIVLDLMHSRPHGKPSREALPAALQSLLSPFL